MIPAPPPPAELPTNVVVVVARVPDRGDESGGLITKKEFDRALLQVATARGRRSSPRPGGAGFRRLKNAAVSELLDDAWIRGQAAEMGIGVRPRGVARELAQIKREAFKSGAEYRRFLREAHYTHREVTDRVELQMLVDRIQERVLLGIRGEAAMKKAYARFVSEYAARWRERTVCAPGYVTERCVNGPASMRASAHLLDLD